MKRYLLLLLVLLLRIDFSKEEETYKTLICTNQDESERPEGHIDFNDCLLNFSNSYNSIKIDLSFKRRTFKDENLP